METRKQTFSDACRLHVEAGTTGLRGGDAGHGGRTELRVENDGGEFTFQADDHSVSIRAAGDAELRTLIQALEFAVATLKASK